MKIVDAARLVFGRRGYGEATIEDIAEEAGVSNGALYHHFANKEELFRAILMEHISDQHFEIAALVPASSLRDLLQRFADYWFEHLRRDHSDDPLFAEIWAQAARDPWAREAATGFIREGADLVAGALKIGQAAGLVRQDLDAQATAVLIYATMQGIFLLWSVDPRSVDPATLTRPWVESMERLLITEKEADLDQFREGLKSFFESQTNGQPSHVAGAKGGE